MKISNIILSALLIFVMSSVSFGQDLHEYKQAEEMTEKLDKRVNLNATQMASVAKINDDFVRDYNAATTTNQRAALKTRRHDDIQDVLTNRQKTLLRSNLSKAN